MSCARLFAAWAAVALAAVFAGATVAGTIRLDLTVARFVVDAAGVACVGLTVALTLLPVAPASRPVALRAARATVIAAGVWLAAIAAAVGVGTSVAAGVPVAQLELASAARWLTELSVGRGLIVTAGCAVIVFAGAALWLAGRGRGRSAALVAVALLGVVAVPITGHAQNRPLHELAVLSFGLHALAAATWLGGLAAILALAPGDSLLLDTTLRRFAPLALACLITITLTGLANAAIQLPNPAALATTGYGRTVLTKTGLLLATAGAAGYLRRRLADHRNPSIPAGIEVAALTATLALATSLATTNPPG